MKEGLKFAHIGIPTTTNKPANYLEGGKVWFNDTDAEPYAIEWLYFEEGSPMPEVLKTKPHIAYIVEDLQKAIQGEKVIVAPFKVNDSLSCAFIEHDGIGIELMEQK